MSDVLEMAKAHFLKGVAYLNSGDYNAAAESLRSSLTLIPDRTSTLVNLQAALIGLKNFNEALVISSRLVTLSPPLPEVYVNLSKIYKETGRIDDAISSLLQALEIDSSCEVAWNNLGVLHLTSGDHKKATIAFQRAIDINPQSGFALNNLGALSMQQGDYKRAEVSLHAALNGNNSYVDAYNNLGNLLFTLKRYPEAIRAYERGIEIAPETHWVSGMLMHARMRICDWADYGGSLSSLIEGLQQGHKVGVPFSLIGLPIDAGLLIKCTKLYVQEKFFNGGVQELNQPHQDTSKIRIAYLSADFQNHATMYLMAELFELHDRTRFEVIGVSYGRSSGDEMHSRAANSFDRFVDCADMSDAEMFVALKSLQIDIAIDLKGHTENSRMGILAKRVAPVQVHYLGYPGSTGAEFIDYLIADNVLIPEAHREFYSEKIAYLPGSYQVNDSLRKSAVVNDSRSDHGLPERGIVFCCFNNNWKITPDLFDVWMRILHHVPGSILWLFEDNVKASENLRNEAEARGIEATRLVFALPMTLEFHLARHRHADIFLDTLYCNAHTTASDALWMGLPLITKLGETFASRVGASLLRAAGLPELVTDTLDQYESVAINLATNPDMLVNLKKRLADNRLKSDLFDAQKTTRNLERVYEKMWGIFKDGRAAEHISV